MKLQPGIIRAFIERFRNSMGLLSFAMICVLYFQRHSFHWWMLGVIVALAVYNYLDFKYMWNQDRTFKDLKSDVLVEILERVRRIEEGKKT